VLEIGVPAGGARDSDGERGCVADDDAAWPVDEADPGNSQPLDVSGEERGPVVPIGGLHETLEHGGISVEQPEQLVIGELGDEVSGGSFDRQRSILNGADRRPERRGWVEERY
jgi:hypothetical protein